MEESFSDRFGITKPSAIQVDSMDDGLRTSLWNFLIAIFEERHLTSRWPAAAKSLAVWFFKAPADTISSQPWESREWVKKRFFSLEWYEVYNLIERLARRIKGLVGVSQNEYERIANIVLANERSGFRFVQGRLEPITSPAEISEIASALSGAAQSGLPDVHAQLDNALDCLAQRPKPDSANAIKEAITAVETLVKTVLGVHGGGLKDALTEFAAKADIHHALRDACLRLYGYASDEPGVRHGSGAKATAGIAEARLVVVASSSFIHYFIDRANEKGLLNNPPKRKAQ